MQFLHLNFFVGMFIFVVYLPCVCYQSENSMQTFLHLTTDRRTLFTDAELFHRSLRCGFWTPLEVRGSHQNLYLVEIPVGPMGSHPMRYSIRILPGTILPCPLPAGSPFLDKNKRGAGTVGVGGKKNLCEIVYFLRV